MPSPIFSFMGQDGSDRHFTLSRLNDGSRTHFQTVPLAIPLMPLLQTGNLNSEKELDQ